MSVLPASSLAHSQDLPGRAQRLHLGQDLREPRVQGSGACGQHDVSPTRKAALQPPKRLAQPPLGPVSPSRPTQLSPRRHTDAQRRVVRPHVQHQGLTRKAASLPVNAREIGPSSEPPPGPPAPGRHLRPADLGQKYSLVCSQPASTPKASPSQYVSAAGGTHPNAEAVRLAPVPAVRLECTLHRAASSHDSDRRPAHARSPIACGDYTTDTAPRSTRAPRNRWPGSHAPGARSGTHAVARRYRSQITQPSRQIAARYQIAGRLWITSRYLSELPTFRDQAVTKDSRFWSNFGLIHDL